MRIKGKLPLFIVAVLAWTVIISSCANIGMPVGGPKDTIPPVLLSSDPLHRELNFDGDNVKLTFNEFLKTDQISEILVISPPLEKRASIKTKSKTLIIQFNEDLKDSVTYSLDFKNSIVDNNEQNPIENLRLSFSTGPDYDSLRIAGRVANGFNLEPIDKGLVLLQSNLHDSAVFRVRPDYIAKTDEEGLFMIDNIAEGRYHVFALNDLNNDMLYNEGAEEIAFLDSIIVPRAEFHSNPDTMVKGVDSMLVLGHTHFYPEPFYMRYFMEDIFDQYMESGERETRNKCLFLFNESVEDTFNVRLLGQEVDDWQLFEYNRNVDSIVMWITDTTLMKNDSLFMELSYYLLDSMGEQYVHNDTLLMRYTDKEVNTRKRKRKEKEAEGPVPIPQFSWVADVSSTMELNGSIQITSPEPIDGFDQSMMRLFLAEDTLKTPLDISVTEHPTAYRTYIVSHNWNPQTGYIFEIDSAACTNIYGITSHSLTKSFKTREEDYYGSIAFDFTSVEMPMIVQLLKNNDDEDVLRQQTFSQNGTVTFEYLKPESYKVKVIYDKNGNGKWDAGSYQDRYQPERVAYVSEVLKLRSNWSTTHPWDLVPDPTFSKNIIDREAEEKKRKAAEEKARNEKESEQNNSMFRPGNSGSSGGIQRFD